ncbi:ribosomal-protein-alanine N-acetyltransferase [Lachnotalea glycerini]|jgi:[ribosomal protein S5]-alanine N-acetyltransferase|uniref:N-acetyltransferase n=1 Tax=Lachnotalea glycerini TaxID=1763509 RepID=A0A255IKN0_9FIRM|nr:GNAT family protein [Lachnotalea glycerini]PXV84915.1 ribosomal-protein-alanine N-acetyltransferase [Lachnotalea glycerini]RDY29906.1 N-acetyltransferase [Lachnotalea glycerini]
MLTYYETNRLILQIITPNYAKKVLDFYVTNKDIFETYEPSRPENFYTEEYQKALLGYEYNSITKMQNVRFWVFKKEDPDKIIGTVSFSNIQPYIYSSCNIGYKFDKYYHHQGYAFEALNQLIDIIFNECHLHRINAYIMPNNTSSKRLIERIGFTLEGIARKCIIIQDNWEDHEQYSLIHDC